MWPRGLAVNGGGALQKTHHCSLEVQCACGCPGPRPPALALEQPDSDHVGPDPGEVSAFPRLAGKQHSPERNPLGRK